MEATSTVQDLARDMARSFETATRPDGTSYVRRVDGSPDWMQEVTMEAHGDMFPDDWRYACIAAACEAIADADDLEDAAHEFADSYVDVYTAALTDWLGSNLYRQGYCDAAAEEFGVDESRTLVDRIMLGQYAEAFEVYSLVLQGLEVRAS